MGESSSPFFFQPAVLLFFRRRRLDPLPLCGSRQKGRAAASPGGDPEPKRPRLADAPPPTSDSEMAPEHNASGS